MKIKALLVAAAAALLACPGAYAAEPVRMATPTDSASCAIAAVMGPLINKNLTQIQGLGVEIDRKVFVQALAEFLDGGDIGFNSKTGDAYIEKRVLALHPAPKDMMDKDQELAFVERAAQTDGAIRLPGGSVLIIEQEGEGKTPKTGQKLTLGYVLRLSDGTELDNTWDKPNEFGMDEVVKGFGEGLKQMKAGGTYRVIVTPDAGYGAEGIPHAVPGNAALDFRVRVDKIAWPKSN